MTMQELMSGLVQVGQSHSQSWQGGRVSSETSSSTGASFSDIFNDRMAYTQHKDTVTTAAKESSAGQRPFRETAVNRKNVNASVGVENGTYGKTDKVAVSDETDADACQVDEKMRYFLMQILGLNVHELQAVMDEAGVTVTDLTSVEGIGQADESLARYLGLNSDEQAALENVIQLAAEAALSDTDVLNLAGTEMVAEHMPESADVGSAVKDDALLLDDIMAGAVKTVQDEYAETNDPAIRILADRIRKKLSENPAVYEAGRTAEENVVHGLAEQMLEQGRVKARTIVRTDAEEPEEVSDTGTAESNVIRLEAGVDENAADMLKGAVVEQIQLQHPETTTVELRANTYGTAFAQKVSELLQPEEIINQVIENAKVIITSDKSEMVMELKPESLGRISLKVITENGIVMAKFVAESQQVRQVLEANMQLLKESLEKQGLNVQGFSVSVGRDNSGADGERHNIWNGRRIKGVSGYYRAADVEMPYAPGMKGIERLGYFRWAEGSTIDLTA